MQAQDKSGETTLHAQVAASQIIMTTQASSSFEATEHVSIVSAQCAFGSQVFHDVFSSVQEVVDGRSKVAEQIMSDGLELVMYELKKKAFELKADAVVGISIQYTPIGRITESLLSSLPRNQIFQPYTVLRVSIFR